MSKPEPMHNRITNADDNKRPPVFSKTPCSSKTCGGLPPIIKTPQIINLPFCYSSNLNKNETARNFDSNIKCGCQGNKHAFYFATCSKAKQLSTCIMGSL